MNRRWAVLGLIAGALLCATPAAAANTPPAVTAPALFSQVSELDQIAELAGRRSSQSRSRRNPSFSVLSFKNRDGYVISVLASQQTVALRVARDYGGRNRRGDRPRRALSTIYLAHGRATPNSIEASFGDRGRISLRFQPSGRDVRASRKAGCKRAGGVPIARLGFFVGELRFRGEDGYTSARVHRARGGSIDLAELLRCLIGGGPSARDASLPSPALPIDLRPFGIGAHRYAKGAADPPGVPTHPSHRPERTILVSDQKLPIARTVFAALKRDSGQARFLGLETSTEGSIGIVRLAFATADGSSFTSDDSLAKAAVDPPPPFSGTASFDHGPGSAKSWTGSLTVSFLGKRHVPLAGPPFEAQLLQGF
jgi:hypothetical protein